MELAKRAHKTVEAPATPVDTSDNGGLGSFRRSVFDIESRTDLSDQAKITRISHTACAACAAVAFQPIPFADILILVPVQAFFASRIAAIRGVPMSESDAQEWTKRIVGLMGLGMLAQQVAIGVWKLVSWGAGGFLTIPLVYSLTFGIMKVADAYFLAQSNGKTLSDAELREILKKAKKESVPAAEKFDANRNA